MLRCKKIFMIIFLMQFAIACHKSKDPLSYASNMSGQHVWHGELWTLPCAMCLPDSSSYTQSANLLLISNVLLKCTDSFLIVDTLSYKSTDVQAKTISFSYYNNEYNNQPYNSFRDSIVYNYSTGSMTWYRNNYNPFGGSYYWTLYSP
jgi:hypothetical protein